jgi:hypothetical protein
MGKMKKKKEQFGNLRVSEKMILKRVSFSEYNNEPSVSEKAEIFLPAEQI